MGGSLYPGRERREDGVTETPGNAGGEGGKTQSHFSTSTEKKTPE